jgi:hypothetical protein
MSYKDNDKYNTDNVEEIKWVKDIGNQLISNQSIQYDYYKYKCHHIEYCDEKAEKKSMLYGRNLLKMINN